MLCVLYRWKISNTFDSGRELSAVCRRHLMRCDRCRSFFTSSLALGERLSLEAALAQPAVPGRLGDQVAAMIGRGVGIGARPRGGHWRSIVAACAAVILMPVVFLAVSHLPTTPTGDIDSAPITTLQNLLGTNTGGVEQVAESVGGLLERPLAAEVESLQRQTKSAVDFLMACSGADMAIRRQAL